MLFHEEPFLQAELAYRRERMTQYVAARALRRRLRSRHTPARHAQATTATRPATVSR